MSEPKLLGCPFCGGTNLKTGGDDKVVGVWCLHPVKLPARTITEAANGTTEPLRR